MSIWPQIYDPLGNIFLSAAIAAIPALLLLTLIAGFNVRIHVAALVALVACLAIAMGIYHMPAAYAGAEPDEEEDEPPEPETPDEPEAPEEPPPP